MLHLGVKDEVQIVCSIDLFGHCNRKICGRVDIPRLLRSLQPLDINCWRELFLLRLPLFDSFYVLAFALQVVDADADNF